MWLKMGFHLEHDHDEDVKRRGKMHSGCNSCPEKESRIALAIKDATMGFVC